jgi:hypothetical protein
MTSATLASIDHTHDHHLGEVGYFNPDQTVITALKRAISNGQDLVLNLDKDNELLLLGSRGEYFAHLANEKRFFTTPVDEIAIEILGKHDKRSPSAENIGRSVDELLWKAAYYSSGGRLMQGCYPADMVEINYWPNLTRLPHTSNTARVIALLSRHPAPVAFVARLLKVPAEEVYQLYSAARCAGLAKPINRKFEEPVLEPHRHQSLISSLMKKISSL